MTEKLKYITEKERAKYEAEGWTVRRMTNSHHGQLGRCIASKPEERKEG